VARARRRVTESKLVRAGGHANIRAMNRPLRTATWYGFFFYRGLPAGSLGGVRMRR